MVTPQTRASRLLAVLRSRPSTGNAHFSENDVQFEGNDIGTHLRHMFLLNLLPFKFSPDRRQSQR